MNRPPSRGCLPLRDVLATGELARRTPKPANHAAESRALVRLADRLAANPQAILDELVHTALELFDAHSAGLSWLEDDADPPVFRWPAIAGAWGAFVNGTLRRDASPCGVVVATNAPQLFIHPERHYADLVGVSPTIVEALLHPFAIDGRPVGTIWVMSHDEARRFDAEDARVLGSLARVAANAYQTLSALAAAREAERRMNEFLSMLSHELRSPLNALLAASRVLAHPAADERARERACGTTTRSVEAIARMVDDLLDVAKIAHGDFSLDRRIADVASLVREVIEDGGHEARRNAVEITSEPIPDPIPLELDALRIAQAVRNLISNAIRFTPAGGRVAVAVRARARDVEIEVADTGAGIAAEVLPRIFEPFFQARGERAHAGLGLGLTIAKRWVEAHGGTISARSDGAGRGSTFSVSLPTGR